MGPRYTIRKLECPYCEYENEYVYYAPTCGHTKMRCENCGRDSDIIRTFEAVEEKDNGK